MTGDDSALRRLCEADPLWVERYEGFALLGRGGAAAVVRTRARALGEDVAVKVFANFAAEDAPRFQEEVRTAQRLGSPYVVRTFSPFLRPGLAWIEQELVEGTDLRQELARRGAPFPAAEALRVGLAVARALLAAHEAGVVHRDVKPANVLLPACAEPAAKLGDFGISRLLGGPRLTHTGALAATPQFAAPEVIAGGGAGPAADLYGLGLCLYLMLSGGRFPFAATADDPPTRWLRAHADEPAIPLAERARGVPRGLAELVDRLLVKDPARRPTAAVVVRELEALAAGPEGSRPPAIVPATAVALLLAAAILTWSWRTPQSEPVAPATRPPATIVAAPTAAVVAPATPSPAATPEPARPSAAPRPSPSAAPPPFRVRLAGELLTVVNAGPALDTPLELLLTLADGTQARAAEPAGLPAGGSLTLALDAFEPPPAAPPRTLEIVAAGGRHRFPLP